MKRFLDRMWQDIRRGESIDIYVSIPLAIILAFLSIVNIVPDTWIGSLTLIVLALLAFASLGHKHKLDDIRTQLSHSGADILLQDFPLDMLNKWEKASEVWIVGSSLGRTLDEQFMLFERHLQKGGSIKVLVMDPRKNMPELIFKHSYNLITPDQSRSRISMTLNRLCTLKAKSIGNLEVRVLDHPVSVGGFAFDSNAPNGKLYIEHYLYKMPQSSLPKLVLNPEDGYWYEFYRIQLKTIWENGEVWKCEPN